MPKPTIGPDAYDQMIEKRDYHLQEAKRIDDAIAVVRDILKGAGKAFALVGRVRARATGAMTNGHASDFVREHARFTGVKPSEEIRRLLALAESRGRAFTRAALSASYYVTRKQQQPQSTPAPAPATAPPDSAYTTRTFADAYADPSAPPYAEARRLEALAVEHGLTFTAKALESVLRRTGKTKAKRAQPRHKAVSNAAHSRALAKAGDRPMDRIRRVLRGATGPIDRVTLAEQARIADVIPDPKYVQQSTAMALKAMLKAKEIKRSGDGFIAHRLKADPAIVGSNGVRA